MRMPDRRQNGRGIKVTVFDSKTVGYLQCKMAFTAHEMAKAGKSMDEIIEELSFIRDNNHVYFAVNDLSYLVKNGRLSNAANFIAGLLKIKPLLEIDKNGAVVTAEKIRTFTKAAIDTTSFLRKPKADYEPFIIHANNPKLLRRFAKGYVAQTRTQGNQEYILTPAVSSCSPKAITTLMF